jgi:hypothetical protein
MGRETSHGTETLINDGVVPSQLRMTSVRLGRMNHSIIINRIDCLKIINYVYKYDSMHLF